MYCPKCDMEFVEGITVCTDCGSPLVDKEEWLIQQAEEKEKLAREAEKAEESTSEGITVTDAEGNPVELTREDLEALREQMKKVRGSMARGDLYIDQKNKYEDKKSSATAFLLVGIAMAALAVLCFLDIVRLGPIVKYMSAAFAVFAIIYAFITNKAAEKGKHLIKEEEDTKSAIIEAFLSEYTKEEIDYKAGGDDLTLSEEELALERLNYIQDRLTTEHDINPSFATEIAEEIYNRIFE